MLVALIAFAIASCGGESAKEREQRLLIDSLQTANMQGSMEYNDLKQYLSVIAEGLDSIAIEENELLSGNGVGEKFNRQRMKQNLSHVREILARHRDRIDELEKKLSGSGAELKNLRTIVTALRAQIDAKDRELASLKSDLEDSRKNVADLTSRMQVLGQEKEEQSQTIQEQAAVIEHQAEEMSQAYIRVGTKKELEAEGLMTGGNFWKMQKSKVDYSNMDTSKFQTVDMRTFKTLSLPKKAKILTQVPKGSYEIEKNGNEQVLKVLNPEKFWSVSKFLIIQIN